MKELKINLKDETYESIERIITWLNLNNQIKSPDKPNDYTIEEIVRGFIISKVEEFSHFDDINPLLIQDIDKNSIIKNRFKEISKNQNITIKQVADQLDMKPPNVSKIWNNKSQPRMELFIKIWIILGCPKLQDCLYIVEED
ncbi:helix-turn-helix domain-containing protein [Aquibacillus saliphilus]|uniref:helix-turn-helix domain-containing protein n=1 Tax=Aquibacillus saliphilus TaxID=1909422 RepID=UPI001CF0C89C|nr:helix-turn-helix transcriptional regulator [Aquibacillus saliphilus]